MSQVKTIRFEALVKASGQPEQVTLWTKPEDDPDFMKAVKQNRVATVIQTNVGTKKDFGVVGFQVKKNAAYLVFPKRLSEENGTKIVGIKYERLAEAEPKGPVFKPKRKSTPGIQCGRGVTIPSLGTKREEKRPRINRGFSGLAPWWC